MLRMASPIDKSSSVPLYRQVKEYILTLINQGEDENLMLPPEIEISTQFNISRATVRTAILELVQEGILERVPGKGTFIKEKPNTLLFANWISREPHTEGIIADILIRFNENRPEGFIKNLGIPYQEIERQLLVLAAGGEAPDISALIYLWTPLLAYNGALEPLDDLYTDEIIHDSYERTLEGVSYEGELYGMNWNNAPGVLFYHREILEECSGSRELDTEYYDELAEIFARIHENSSGEIIPFSIPILDDELFFLFSLSPFLKSFGGGIFDEAGEIIFHSSENQEAFRWLKTFIRRGHVNITNKFWKNRKLFSIGKLAFALEGPWMRRVIPFLGERPESDLTDIGFSPLPKTPNGKSCSILWNHTLSIFKQCRNKELARDFIRYLVFDPGIAEEYYRTTGMLPAMKNEVETNPVYDDPLGKVLKQQMKSAYPVRVFEPASFVLSVSVCAKAAREILLGERNIPGTLNTHAEIIRTMRR
jgi:ABC-type glycerol-3-phosphate transport system substrate-binding protein